MLFESLPFEPRWALLGSTLFVLMIILKVSTPLPISKDQNLPTVNRSFAQEPRFLALIRWTVNAHSILENAYKRFGDSVCLVARGDIDLVVVPTKYIQELNGLPETIINSATALSYNLVGHLNGIEWIAKTHLHFKTVQHKLTPALPRLTPGLRSRVGSAIEHAFPYDSREWVVFEPMGKVLHCVSRATSFVLVGTPMCDDPEYIRLTAEHAKHVFTVTIILRAIPSFLRSSVVWLLPSKWRLERSLKGMEAFIVPEVQRRAKTLDATTSSDVLSWMIEKSRDEGEADPGFLTQLVSTLTAGSTHTTMISVFYTLYDLAAHPQFQDCIREEIKAKHQEIQGDWDHAAFDGLPKLDSALKETSRMSPSNLGAYYRLMVKDYELSNGVTLKKGQMICVSNYCRQRDPAVFPEPETYNALRAYNLDLQTHINRPFSSVDNDILRWGSGRGACPGRFLATLEAKLILVKLLDEFDFKLVSDDQRRDSITLHEFIHVNERTQLLIRRRNEKSGIEY